MRICLLFKKDCEEHRKTMNITKRERVRMAVQHVQPDKVPWSIELTDAALVKMAEYYAEPRLAEPEFFSLWVGNHFVRVGPTGKGQFHGLEEQVEPGIWRDGWGIIWDTRGVYGEGEWGRPINCVLTKPNLENFEFQFRGMPGCGSGHGHGLQSGIRMSLIP